jgi:hypothetical protein
MSDLEDQMRRRFLKLSLREIHDREAGRARASRIVQALRGVDSTGRAVGEVTIISVPENRPRRRVLWVALAASVAALAIWIATTDEGGTGADGQRDATAPAAGESSEDEGEPGRGVPGGEGDLWPDLPDEEPRDPNRSNIIRDVPVPKSPRREPILDDLDESPPRMDIPFDAPGFEPIEEIDPPKPPPMSEALARLRLPPNASREEVEAYITAVIATIHVAERALAGPDDPEVEKLVAVGPANVASLLAVLEKTPTNHKGFTDAFGPRVRCTAASICLLNALDELVKEEHEALVLASLPRCTSLARYVLKFSWAEAAHDTLTARIEMKETYLPVDWIKAVAVLRDPGTCEALKWYLREGENPRSTHRAIEGLPGIDLADTVAAGWRRAKKDGTDTSRFAGVAFGYGHRDALEVLVEELAHYGGSIRRKAVAELRGHLKYDGRDMDLRAWLTTHLQELVFDAETRRWRLPE